MTTGEKIKFYRKKFGLSQEELGQKLLVSRQTVSLWEKDQTVPTIDNLIRLRDIFNVSVDEILGCKSKDQEHEEVPNETYQFRYSEDECLEIYKLLRNFLIRRAVIFSVLCFVLLLFFIVNDAPDVLNGCIIGVFILGIYLNTKAIIISRGKNKKSIARVPENLYEYRFFDDFLTIRIIKNNEIFESTKVYFKDIEQIQDIGKYLLLIIRGRSFILRKENLSDNCAVYLYMKSNTQKVLQQKSSGKLRIISNVLFVLSLLSIFGILILLGWISSINNLFIENMWVCFLLTPFPIASAVFGFILKSKNYKYKKNVIAGIVITVILCIYGSFTFIFSDVYDHSSEPVLRIEQLTGINIPEYRQINTQDWTKGTQSVSRGYIHYTSDVYFNEDAIEDFKKQLKYDSKWLASVPNNLIGITSPFSDYGFYDYVLIYNVDTGEYNALPENNGTYTFINVCLSSELERMKIVEYEIEYKK